MTPAQESYAAMWLAEMGAVVREVPREERAAARAVAGLAQHAATEGFAACRKCGVVFRQVPSARPWEWCAECVGAVAS